MKQHITEKQYSELSEERKDVWYKWAVKRGHTMRKVYGEESEIEMLLGFPSIGEMIEFLDKKGLTAFTKSSGWHGKGWNVLYCIEPAKELSEKEFERVMKKITKRELCDALFEAVKEVLEQKQEVIKRTKR